MGDDITLPGDAPSLDEVRARLDTIDGELLRLVDERASLAIHVARAKHARGEGHLFGLRVGREAEIMRRLLSTRRQGASDALTVRLWRELIADSLARQGPFSLHLPQCRDLPRLVETARFRFGSAPPITYVANPEDAVIAAREQGAVAILPLDADKAWWGRLLVERETRIFAALPCLNAWGPIVGLAAGKVAVEPTGSDQTFWVTDAPWLTPAIEEALGRDGVAASLLANVGGLKLFSLAGFFMPDDERLARAPGSLTGVIGAAPLPFDL